MEGVTIKGGGRSTTDGLWVDRSVLVTGANGFLGSHLTSRLVELGAQVSVFLRPGSQRLRINSLLSKVKIIEGDLTDSGNVSKAIERSQPEFVYHLAASGVVAGDGDETIVVVNALGTLYLLEACLSCSVSRFVYAGSSFEYGAGSNMSEGHQLVPTSVYAASKVVGHAMTHAVGRTKNLSVVSVRPFTVYGPWERTTRLVPYTIVRALKGSDIHMTRGEQERDYIYIDDVVEGFLLAGQCSEAVGRTFNLCSGQAMQIKDIVSRILTRLGTPVRTLYGAIPYRADEMLQQSGNNSLAKTVLGWTPSVSLDRGLAQTIDWYQSNPLMAEQLG